MSFLLCRVSGRFLRNCEKVREKLFYDVLCMEKSSSAFGNTRNRRWYTIKQHFLTKADFTRSLPEYLSRLADALYQGNRQRRMQTSTADQWCDRRVQLHEFFTDAIGGLPERTPLNQMLTGTAEADGFSIEKLLIESRPDFLVTANLYVPQDLDGPAPAVLIPCGHSANGKAAEPYQKVAISLALSGMVALIYDPVGQGERVQYYDEQLGTSTVGACTLEHSQMDNQCHLLGSSIAGYRIYDGIRCLDYLQSRPDVDAERLGCTGCSGGGTLPTYLLALDARIKVAMPVCYITTLQARQETDQIADGEQNIHAQLAFGMDHHEMAAMTAPRALRIGAAEEDFFPLHGAQATAEFCRQVYRLLGANDRFDLFVGPGGHGYSDHMRRAAVEWFCLHFDLPPSEADPTPFVRPDGELYCTETGQVVTGTNSRRVYQVNLESFEEANPNQAPAPTADQLRNTVAETLGLRLPVQLEYSERFDPRLADIEPVSGTDYHLLAAEDGPVAALFVNAATSGAQTVVRLLVQEEPDYSAFAQAAAHADHPHALLTACGTGIFDVRAHGLQNFEQHGSSRARLLGREAFASYYAKIMGFSLLKLRVADILGALALLRREYNCKSVLLEGQGRAGIWALHAAVLDGAVAQVRLLDTLWAYELTLRDGEYLLPHMADIARGSLLHYDLPQLCAALAPPPLEIIRPLNSRGQVYEMSDTPAFQMLKQAYDKTPDILIVG